MRKHIKKTNIKNIQPILKNTYVGLKNYFKLLISKITFTQPSPILMEIFMKVDIETVECLTLIQMKSLFSKRTSKAIKILGHSLTFFFRHFVGICTNYPGYSLVKEASTKYM